MGNNDFYDAQPRGQAAGPVKARKELRGIDLVFIGVNLLLIALSIYYREWIFRYLAGIIYRLVPKVLLVVLILVGIAASLLKKRKEDDRRYHQRYDRRDG